MRFHPSLELPLEYTKWSDPEKHVYVNDTRQLATYTQNRSGRRQRRNQQMNDILQEQLELYSPEMHDKIIEAFNESIRKTPSCPTTMIKQLLK